mgnify:CR=1 FL=1
MKQNQTVTLPVLEAKKSTFSAWCEKENQLFSCVLESVVTNRQVCLMAHASLAFSVLVCAAFVSAVPALLCLAWFVVSLHLAWKGVLR